MLVHVRDRQPLVDFRDFERDVDRIMRSAFGFEWPAPSAPAFSVVPDGDGVTIRAELPGVDPSTVNVSVENRILTLAAERAEAKRHAAGYRLRERTYGRFSHALRLSDDLDPDAVKAECRDGILTVRIPKRPVAKPRQIDIKVA